MAVETAASTVTGAQTAGAAASRLQAEVEALSEILDANDHEQWPPVFDSLSVDGEGVSLATNL